MVQWLWREVTDRKVCGSNSTSASRLPLSRLGQPGSIPALLLLSGCKSARHRKGITAERLLFYNLTYIFFSRVTSYLIKTYLVSNAIKEAKRVEVEGEETLISDNKNASDINWQHFQPGGVGITVPILDTESHTQHLDFS
ncbi:hypothetical protein CSKR_108424 [Clonorchis sinensis]|uniref:Uncharacterized protein n=1 Tax=Clonorchis sinensis TaxID=79923 RepID=A0A3R7CY55_CLOSI|nr:hypothetical protein CSKR_108424 [Clonorchis sinensis]